MQNTIYAQFGFVIKDEDPEYKCHKYVYRRHWLLYWIHVLWEFVTVSEV